MSRNIVQSVVSFLVFWLAPVAAFAFVCILTTSDTTRLAVVREFLGSTRLFLISVGFVLLCAGLEHIQPYRRAWNRPDRQALYDWGHYLVAVVGSEIAGRALVFATVPLLVVRLPEAWRDVWPGSLPLLLQIGLGVILFDLVYYCYHRASHRVGWLWALHRLHHSPERLTVTKGFRHTFPEWGLDVVLHTTVFTLVAMPPRVMFWVYAITIPIGILSHANLGGKILTWPANALNLPATHRIHHDRASRGGFSNFSAFTMLWDHVFGTFVSPGRYEPERLGTADYATPKGFFRQVFSFLPRNQTETRSRDAASSSSLNPNRRGSLSRST